MKVKKKRGFTLIEMIVALATFTIVMLAITGIIISVIKYTSINKSNYDTDNISKVFFETIRENRPNLSDMPADSEVCYKGEFSTKDEVRTFIKDRLFELSNRPSSVSNPDKFSECKSNTSDFSIGIKLKYYDDMVNVVDSHDEDGDGDITEIITKHAKYYEIETWCWDSHEGESSLVNRKTYVTPK